jgi:fucose permease
MARARRGGNGAADGADGAAQDENIRAPPRGRLAVAEDLFPGTARAAAAEATTPLLPPYTANDDENDAPNAALERAFRPWPAVFAYCLAFLGFGAASNVLGPTVDALAARLPGGATRAADLWVVFFTGGLVSTLGAVPSGWLIDLHPRVPGHRLLAVAMLSQAFGLLAIHRASWASASLVGLVGCNALVSLTLNLVNTGVNTYSLWSARRSGGGGAVLVNAVHLFFGAGALCAPLLVMLSTRLFGEPLAAFDLSAGIVAAIAAVFWVVPSPPRPREAGGGCGEQEQQQEEESGDGDGTAGLVRGPSSSSSSIIALDTPTTTAAFWSTRQGRLILLLATGFTLLCVGMEVAVGGWSATFAREAGAQDAQAARGMNSLYWLCFTLGRLVASAAAAVTTPTQGLAASLPVLAVGAAVAIGGGGGTGGVGAAVAIGGGGGGTGGGDGIGRGRLAAALALFGLGYAPQFANVIAALDEVAPVPGWINGLLGGTASAGVMLVPPALGLAAASERLGLSWGVLPWSVVLATALQALLLVGQTAAVKVARRGRREAEAAKRARARGGGVAENGV